MVGCVCAPKAWRSNFRREESVIFADSLLYSPGGVIDNVSPPQLKTEELKRSRGQGVARARTCQELLLLISSFQVGKFVYVSLYVPL